MPKFAEGQAVTWTLVIGGQPETGAGVVTDVQPSRMTTWCYLVELLPGRRFTWCIGEPDLTAVAP